MLWLDFKSCHELSSPHAWSVSLNFSSCTVLMWHAALSQDSGHGIGAGKPTSLRNGEKRGTNAAQLPSGSLLLRPFHPLLSGASTQQGSSQAQARDTPVQSRSMSAAAVVSALDSIVSILQILLLGSSISGPG